MNKLPCLYGFIASTKTGDRNTNLFKAINHLRHYNRTASSDEIVNEALQINNSFANPLSEHEVTVVCKHVMAKDYRTSCWKFKKYCKHCRYGKFRKSFNQSKPKYWKHINKNNRLVNIKGLPDDKYYPWDILDTENPNDLKTESEKEANKILSDEEVEKRRNNIYRFRQENDVNINIDRIVKNYGIPIGDKAKNEWERFKKRNNK